jgi:hypothetical protein
LSSAAVTAFCLDPVKEDDKEEAEGKRARTTMMRKRNRTKKMRRTTNMI